MDPILLGVIALVALLVYFTPAFIAFYRGHEYRWVILGINLFGGVTVILWLLAFVWAVFPSNRTFADTVLGSATGKGERNIGDAVGASLFGVQRGYERETRERGDPYFPLSDTSNDMASRVAMLERLQGLRQNGALSEAEFEDAKHKLFAS